MKAILTKCLPATNHKPTRIKAYTEGGNSLTLSCSGCEENQRTQGEAHLYAAEQLALKMGWPGLLIGGGTPDGYCFVFADSYIRSHEKGRAA